MTDSEKLDLSLQKTIGIENEVQILRKDVDMLKAEVNILDRNIRESKIGIVYLKVNSEESQRYSSIILNEIKSIHSILDLHKTDKEVRTA